MQPAPGEARGATAQRVELSAAVDAFRAMGSRYWLTIAESEVGR